MPKPLPDYVPPLVASRMAYKGYKGLSGLATAAGLPQTTVNGLFREGQHRSLVAFRKWCDELGISEDYGVEILQMVQSGRTEDVREIFDTLRPGWTGRGNGYYYHVLNGDGGKRILELYLPIVQCLDIDIHSLANAVSIAV